MTLATNHSSTIKPIYIQPNQLSDYLFNQHTYCLLLDIDGTLAEFTVNPKDSVIADSTLALLKKIQNYGVQVAMVTGRSLEEARQMVFPLHVPIAATHGLEIEFDSKNDSETLSSGSTTIPLDTAELNHIKQTISQLIEPYTDFSLEEKPYSCALHYRQNPSLADAAHSIMLETVKTYPNWAIKHGKFVWEILPKGINKGTAILTLLNNMQQASVTNEPLHPIFIGDDVTDEAGFKAVQGDFCLEDFKTDDSNKDEKVENINIHNGMGIKVGNEPTCAHYYVNNICEVTALLEEFLTFYQTSNTLASTIEDFITPIAKRQPTKKRVI